jgi:hypothetical protein
MSMFREAPTPDSPKGQVSIRRVIAAFFAAIFGALAVSITLHFSELAALGNAAIGVAGVLLGAPLIGIILLLFFTTWGDVAAIVAAASGKGQA